MNSTSERWLDGLLAVAALAFAILQLVLSPPPPLRAGIAEVRALEDLGRIHDTGDSYAPWVRAFIGLEGTAEDTPAAVVEATAERLHELPPGRELRLVVAAIAASYGVAAVADTQLDALEQATDLSEAHRASAVDLRRLARGEPVDRVERAIATLVEAGASPWLAHRLRARALTLAGDAAGAEGSLSLARASASASVAAHMGTLVVQLAVLALGALALALLPWILPRLRRRGFGLGPGPSVFLPDRIQRVMLTWFLGSVATGWVFSSVASGAGPASGATFFAAILALQILTHGAIGVALVQRVGRAPDDARPLAPALGLGVGMMPGRAASLAAWLLPGLGFAALVTFSAQIANLFLFGEPVTSQGAVELLMGDGATSTFALLLVSAAIVAPLVEEVLFRGYLYRALRSTVGPLTAVLFSGLVFGAVHLDPERLLPLAALGSALALLYEWSGSLLVPIAVHGLWNFLQLASVWAIYHVA